jgi:hypothetical protein
MPPPCYVCEFHHLISDCLFFSRCSFGLCSSFASAFSRYCFFGSGSFQLGLEGSFVAGHSVRVSPNLSFFRLFISFSHVWFSLCEGNDSKVSFYNKLSDKKFLIPRLCQSFCGQVARREKQRKKSAKVLMSTFALFVV